MLSKDSTIDTSEVSQMKIDVFNDVNLLITKLSENGIGELKPWSNQMDLGYGSLTNYFEYGNPKIKYGLSNNFAYYLEGSETKAKNLLVNLNINNPNEKKQALNYLNNLSIKTFKSLNLKIPLGLLQAIKASKKFKVETKDFNVSYSLDKSKIETWKLLIVSK